MATTFTDLGIDPRVVRNLPALGITHPNHLQVEAIPCLVKGESLAVQANTNSGKTALAVIPSVHEVVLGGNRGVPQLLALTATRTVAIEYGRVLSVVSANTGLNVGTFVGSIPIYENHRQLRGKPELIAGAVGRVADLVRSGKLDLSKVKQVIFDEVDALVEGGIDEHLGLILQKLPRDRRTICTSATFAAAERFLPQLAPGSRIFQFGEVRPAANVERIAISLRREQRFDALVDILDNRSSGPTVIFMNSKVEVQDLWRGLCRSRRPSVYVTGDLKQEDRDRRISAFNLGEVNFIVASDVLARGFHSDRVKTIVNWDVAQNFASFVHRIGRAARKHDTQGKCYIFVTSGRDRDRLSGYEERIAAADVATATNTRNGGEAQVPANGAPRTVAPRTVAPRTVAPRTVVEEARELLLGFPFKRPEVVLAAFEQGGSLEPSHQPHHMERLGRAALARGITEVFARLGQIGDAAAFRDLLKTFTSNDAIAGFAEQFRVKETFATLDGKLTVSQMLLRSLGVQCVDGSPDSVAKFFLMRQEHLSGAGKLTELFNQAPVPTKAQYPIASGKIRDAASIIRHRFDEPAWIQMALVGNAAEAGILSPSASLIARGETALALAIVDELRINRSLQRPDLLDKEADLTLHIRGFWASDAGTSLFQLLTGMISGESGLKSRDDFLFGLMGAVDLDVRGVGINRVVKRLFPFVTQPLPSAGAVA